MATLASRLPPRGGALLAVAAVLIAASIFAVGYLALSALRSATGTVASTQAAGLAGAVAVAPVALATPIDVAQFHATAEAGLNRPPEQRQAQPPTATPPPAATKPSAPAKSEAAPKPAGGVAPAGTPLPVVTPRPTVTSAPTRTPTITTTVTPTQTPTPTHTETPIPSPCEAPIEVPRLFTGNGFYTTVTHEVAGVMAASWDVVGGEIRVYAEKPRELGAERSGLASTIPAAVPLRQGLSGARPLNVGDRPPGDYVVYFFNGSRQGLGPIEGQITYWTYGHCP